MADIPSSVRVGYMDYAIECMQPLEGSATGAVGLCKQDLGVIELIEGLPVQSAAGTLFHEVLHACWYMANLPPGPDEEMTVSALSNVLVGVIRDNPRLIAYLQEALS